MTAGRPRLAVMAVAALYIVSFHFAYLLYLEPVFGNFGFRYDQTSRALLGLAWFLAWLPSLWLSAESRKPTSFTYWLLYLAVLVPSILVPAYVGRLAPAELVRLMIYLTASYALVGYFHRLEPLRIHRRTMSPELFHLALLAPALLLTLYLAVKLHGQFRLVSFGNVYDQRAASTAAMSVADRYVTMWLATGFFPFFLTYGLLRRKPLWLVSGIGGQLLIYSLTALKNVAVMPVIYLVLYFALRKQRRLGLFAATGAVGLLIVSLILYTTTDSHWTLLLGAIVLMRTFGVPGLCTQQYYEFFSAHPLTYFSQVTGVGLLIPYPYSRSIYYEIGDAFYRNPELSANAHFWALDGISSLGLPGMLLMSVLCGLVFWVFDSLGEIAGRPFVTLLLIAFGIQITNGSLFTTLTTGGGLIAAFYLYFLPEDFRPEEDAPASNTRLTKGVPA